MSNHHSQRGYTLIELIVSVGIFSIVMLLASGAYLSLISYTREARAVSTVMTSLSYGIDQMSREIRTGTDYQCGTGGCANASSITVTNDQGHTVSYLLADGAIARCVDESVCTAAIAVPLTDPSIDVTSLVFNVKGNTSSSDGVQPYVTMTVRGEAAVAGESPVPFSIETSASQRTLDLGGSSGGSGGSGDDGGGDTGGDTFATGGTVTQSGGYTIHTFTSNGTFTPTTSGTVDVLVIGGGGGGGSGNSTQCVMGGGGGAGGFVYQAGVAVSAQSYSITVGAGGQGGWSGALNNGVNGGSSFFGSVVGANGGGGGGYGNCSGAGGSGSVGASGGGGGYGTGGTVSGGAGGTGGHNGATSQTGGTSGGGGGA